MSFPFSAALLDTSVVVKWFIMEGDSERATDLRQAHVREELQLHAPDILLMELANALRYSPLVSTEEIPQALNLFSDLDVATIPLDLNVLTSAVSLSLEHDLAVYDAYFLAMARTLDIPLITADRKMLSRLTAEDGAVDLKSI